MNDIKICEELMEKAKYRELGIKSMSYYYALKHLIEFCKDKLEE